MFSVNDLKLSQVEQTLLRNDPFLNSDKVSFVKF